MNTGERGRADDETLLQQITRAYYELLPAFEQHIGVTRARWHLLKHLWCEEQLTQAALQQRAQVDGAAVTRQMKQLEEAGLVARGVDPQDNRFTIVRLTPQGRRFVAELLERRARFEARVLAGLSPSELAALQGGLATVRANLARLAGEGSRPGEMAEGGDHDPLDPRSA